MPTTSKIVLSGLPEPFGVSAPGGSLINIHDLTTVKTQNQVKFFGTRYAIAGEPEPWPYTKYIISDSGVQACF